MAQTGAWRLGRPVTVAAVTLWPVERVRLQDAGLPAAGLGVLEPVAVVVRSPVGTAAFDLQGRSLPLQSLLQKLPELAAALQDE